MKKRGKGEIPREVASQEGGSESSFSDVEFAPSTMNTTAENPKSDDEAPEDIQAARGKIENMEPTFTIEQKLEQLERKGDLNELFTEVVERISRETTFLQLASEFGIDKDIVDGFPDQKVEGVPIEWGVSNVSGKAEYGKRPKINIKAEKPDQKSMLLSLVEHGKLPIGVRAVLDGAAHYYVQPKGLKKLFGTQTRELVAAFKLVVHQSLNRKKRTQEERFRNRDRVQKQADSKSDGTARQAEEAIRTVEGLLALGYSAKGVGDLIGQSRRWNASEVSFGKPTDALRKEMAAAGLDDVGLQERIESYYSEREKNRDAAIAIARDVFKLEE